MTDYRQELIPPAWRNLVINPGGEPSSLGSGYLASNGTVRSGALVAEGAPAPLGGTGVVEYQVAATTSQSYWFAPFGPGDPVHLGAFKIPLAGTVSGRVKVRASAAVWAEVQVSWLVAATENGQTVGVTELSKTVALTAVSVGTGAWVTLQFLVAAVDVPPGVTHWRPTVAVYSGNPATTPSPPVLGTKVWAEEFFVPDSGASLASVAYGDGDTAGWVWEGDRFYSSSRTADTSPSDPVGTDAAVNTQDPTETDTGTEAAHGTDDPGADELPPELPPPPPPAPDIAVKDEGFQSATARPAWVTAEDVIGWRGTNRHVHLHEDVQLGDLVMNRMDEQGVVWLVSDIDGWWTTPEPDVPDVPRGWFDGSYETRGRYNARTFTLTGSFVPRSPNDVAAARDRLIRALNLVHAGGWFMTHEDPVKKTNTKGSKVWLAGQPLIGTTGLNGKTDFSIALRAPNPVKQSIKNGVPPGFNEVSLLTTGSDYPERKYPRTYPWKYPEAVFGSTRAEVTNAGNIVVWPILRLAGPTNGALRIYNVDTGQDFRVAKKLYPGEVLEVDCHTKQVTLNGAGNHRFYLDVDVDWLMLKPGPNKIYFAEETLGTIRTTLQILWRSGWIG